MMLYSPSLPWTFSEAREVRGYAGRHALQYPDREDLATEIADRSCSRPFTKNSISLKYADRV